MIDHSTSSQTTAVRGSTPLEADRLGAWLAANVPEAHGPFAVRQFAGGQSNPTYSVETPSRRYVVRRKPSGPLLPSAHQIEREYRILRALEPTGVPVPRALALCEDAAVIGTPFFVMEFLDGRIFRDPALPDSPPAERRGLYEGAVDALAALHRVDIAAAGLDDYGRRERYLERQIARWSKQYDASRTDEIAEMEPLGAWLAAHVPGDDDVAIAHGDFRLENLVIARDETRAIGILDWELSTLGHPLLDLAYLTLMHHVPADVLRDAGSSGAVAGVEGVPSAAHLVARYAGATGRASVPDLRFFYALAFFRAASIAQGIRKRIEQGNAAGHDAARRASFAPALAKLGYAMAHGS